MLKIMSMDLGKDRVKTLVVPVCEDFNICEDKKLDTLVKGALALEEFSGKKKQKLVLYSPKGIQADRVVFIGLGKKEKIDSEVLRVAAGTAVGTAIGMKLNELCVAMPSAKKLDVPEEVMLEALMEGAFLANEVLDTYKLEKKNQPLAKICILVTAGSEKKYASLVKSVTAACEGTLLARYWVNMPSNLKSPEAFADEISLQANRQKLKVTVLDEKTLARKKFGAMLAVGEGSDHKPRLVVLEYTPKKARKTIALVGKGVVFDSGGINLKPSASLDTMKTDMAGAAAVAATLIAAARIKPDVRVVGIMPLVENMPSGHALRPGDIITSLSGKSIEVGNTDAEGRLILADAMTYAMDTFKPDMMIDMATLTGACVIALGEKIAGVFGRGEELTQAVVAAGKKTAEHCWAMPMPEEYRTLLKSDLADINNMSSSRYGGAITAAIFLSEFTGELSWAHIDIAGPARNGKATDYCPPGGSGFGVRLLLEVLKRI